MIRPLYLIDSNVFLRGIIQDDKRAGQDCMSLFRAIAEGTCEVYIPTLVFAEIQFVLKSFYGFEKPKMVEALASVMAIQNLQIYDDCSMLTALELFSKYTIKFFDCLLASSKRVQEGEAGVLSYDHEFDKLGIRRVEPDDLLKILRK